MVPTLLSMAILASVKPLTDSLANQLEIFNSCMILLMIYCMMLFTPFVADPEMRHQIGYCLVLLTVLNIAFNILVVSHDPVR